ncbi:E3 ubiquitin-protein ligase SIAH1-like [Echinops telfairi]|uniref:E3 ubiquitin-protein ligase n=1 Tax=Echinops telfairi TaxID=9371 RepID=A0ABM0IZ65_ECHTE|nr:E3 ubiquitin-protein ligase SIAH1-like [Echinops telfairi]
MSHHGSPASASNAPVTHAGIPASNSFLVSLFECPVCYDSVLPPILQCENGHLVCNNCHPKLELCPTCRVLLGSIRNLALEKLANLVQFPCKYALWGCERILAHTEKADHQVNCEFRLYSCPFPGVSCNWMGLMNAAVPHLIDQHRIITTQQGEDTVFFASDIFRPGIFDWVMIQCCFGFNFMVVLHKRDRYGDQKFFAVVQLIGTHQQAQNFVYKLELHCPRQSLTWKAIPRSLQEGIKTAILGRECLMFNNSVAKLFAKNGNLSMNVKISRC